MKIFANKEIKKLFLAVSVIWVAFLLLTQGFLWLCYQRFSLFLLLVFVLSGGAILAVGCSYFKKQNQVMEQAVSQLQAYLDGDHNARIECDEEGELYRLFHTVNSMAAVLNAHADNELREKEFLKNTISDISHQLKTPLAALNIYNAFDHTESGAVIGITWRALPSGIQIVVKDNGCGIHPEDIHHIFKRFYRSRFSKDTQGIGLGLPLAKAVIEAHGGAIEVDSELGRGTSFTINFLIPTKL